MKNKQDIFLELFEPVKDNIWRFCLSISRSRVYAKDLLQDTIETAYRNFENIKHKEAFLSYLFTVASRINRASNDKNARYSSLNEVDFESLAANDTSPEKLMDIKLLYSALDILPYEQKEAIILLDIMGFSQKEICDIQSVSLDTLKQRLYRGRRKLSEILHDEYSDVKLNGTKLSPKGEIHE